MGITDQPAFVRRHGLDHPVDLGIPTHELPGDSDPGSVQRTRVEEGRVVLLDPTARRGRRVVRDCFADTFGSIRSHESSF